MFSPSCTMNSTFWNQPANSSWSSTNVTIYSFPFLSVDVVLEENLEATKCNASILSCLCYIRPGYWLRFAIRDQYNYWSNVIFHHLSGCSRGYNIRLYVQELSTINTQIAEQRNSTLRRLKAMLSYMSQKNFIDHLSLFIWFRNVVLSRSERENNQIVNKIFGLFTKSVARWPRRHVLLMKYNWCL